jgi:phosphatidylglycerophosphate synthase
MFPLNLPNALTVLRKLLVPVLVVAVTVESREAAERQAQARGELAAGL